MALKLPRGSPVDPLGLAGAYKATGRRLDFRMNLGTASKSKTKTAEQV